VKPTRTLAAGCRYQFAVLGRSPADLTWLFVSPVYAVVFLVILNHAGRSGLAAYAVIGPAVMGLVGTAVSNAGDIIEQDRWDSMLELEVAAPASLSAAIVGRVLAVMLVGLLAIPEVWLVAGLLFGQWVSVRHPVVLVSTAGLTVLATCGTATMMSALFVLARSARLFQNTLTVPLFVLGGAIVPVHLLPGWLIPPARLVYLSWATDLLRDATATAPLHDLWGRLAVLAGLGAASICAGVFLVRRVVLLGRAQGSLGFA
jgi:ABC-2 type transport system permease protein